MIFDSTNPNLVVEWIKGASAEEIAAEFAIFEASSSKEYPNRSALEDLTLTRDQEDSGHKRKMLEVQRLIITSLDSDPEKQKELSRISIEWEATLARFTACRETLLKLVQSWPNGTLSVRSLVYNDLFDAEMARQIITKYEAGGTSYIPEPARQVFQGLVDETFSWAGIKATGVPPRLQAQITELDAAAFEALERDWTGSLATLRNAVRSFGKD